MHLDLDHEELHNKIVYKDIFMCWFNQSIPFFLATFPLLNFPLGRGVDNSQRPSAGVPVRGNMLRSSCKIPP